jgi:hypothetical protein
MRLIQPTCRTILHRNRPMHITVPAIKRTIQAPQSFAQKRRRSIRMLHNKRIRKNAGLARRRCDHNHNGYHRRATVDAIAQSCSAIAAAIARKMPNPPDTDIVTTAVAVVLQASPSCNAAVRTRQRLHTNNAHHPNRYNHNGYRRRAMVDAAVLRPRGILP